MQICSFVPSAYCAYADAALQVRDIQLANPTRRVLSYTARLEGSSDFALEASVVKIDPGRSTQVACCEPTTVLARRFGLTVAVPLAVSPDVLPTCWHTGNTSVHCQCYLSVSLLHC